MALDRLTIITSSGLSTVSDYVIDGLRAVGVVTASTVQVGAATTVHTTGVDLGSGNITSHNINSTGIITATGVTVTGDLTVEGTLAYDDVTNIDSTGIVTARSGIHVTGGQVGINTTVPTEKLDVLGTIRASAGTNQYMHMYPVAGAGYFDVRNATSYPSIIFRQIGSGGIQERLRITSGGYIGIGTDNPICKLVVNSGTTNLATQIVSDDAEVFLAFKDGDSTGNQQVQIGGVGNNFVAYAGGTEKLRIKSDGNIGIGENNPAAKLDVKDSKSNTVDIRLRNTESNAQMSLYAFGGSAAIGSHYNNRIAMMSWNSTEGIDIITNGTGDNDFRVYTAGYGTNSERFRITSAGLVGIDNTSPGTKLAIGGSTIDSSNVLTFGKRVAGSNSNLPVIGHHSDGTGSGIAICATSTDGKIHFFTGNGSAGFGDGSNAERMRIDAIGDVTLGYAGNSLYFQNGFNDSTSRIQNGGATNNSNLKFFTRSSGTEAERLRITSGGDVLIADTTNSIYDDSTGGGMNLKSNGQLVLKKQATSTADPLMWLNDTGQTTNKFILFAQDGNEKASIGLAGNDLRFARDGYNETLRITSAGRVSIGGVTSPLGALHIEANQGTDTALWIGDNSSSRYLAINEQSSSSSFNHVITRFNDNAIHAHYILDNPYAQGTGYGSQILFRGNNQATTAYIETSNEASGSARGTLRLRGADNHGLDVRSTGEVNTTHASNIGYQSNAATNTRSLVYQSEDPQRQEPTASNWYVLKSFWPSKSGTVNMHAQMYIQSGTYYFSFRVREEGTDTIVFNAGDNGGYGAYATDGNAVHSYKTYKWVCPLIKAHKRYYIEMAATNSAGTNGPYTSVGQWLYLKNFRVYSMSPGHSVGTEAMQIAQSQDVSSAQSYSGTTHFYMSPGVNRDSINVTQYFGGTESTFLGWFTTRAYNRYLDFELNMSGSYMWFAQAYGYLYSRGQVAGSMISGYTYTNNQILNKYSVTVGNRGWYGSYRTSSGNLCLKFDSGGNGYSEGRIALFLGTHGPTNPEWRVLQYRQNDTTNNIF